MHYFYQFAPQKKTQIGLGFFHNVVFKVQKSFSKKALSFEKCFQIIYETSKKAHQRGIIQFSFTFAFHINTFQYPWHFNKVSLSQAKNGDKKIYQNQRLFLLAYALCNLI